MIPLDGDAFQNVIKIQYINVNITLVLSNLS